MVLEYLRSHESWCTNKAPSTMSGNELTDTVVRQLHVDHVDPKSGGTRNGIVGIGKLPDEHVLTLQITVDNSIGVEVLDRRGNLEAGTGKGS